MCEFIKSEHVHVGYGCCRCHVYNGLQRANCKSCGVTHCELSVPKGMTGEYHEEGGVTEVEVLSVEVDDKGVGFELKAIRTVRESSIVNDIQSGTLFSHLARALFAGVVVRPVRVCNHSFGSFCIIPQRRFIPAINERGIRAV